MSTVCCCCYNQGFLLPTGQRSAILLARYAANWQLCGLALIGEVNNHYRELTYDMPFPNTNNQDTHNSDALTDDVNQMNHCLGNLLEGDSFEIILVTSIVANAKCYCRNASISLY